MDLPDFQNSRRKLAEAREKEYVAYEQMRQNSEESRRITERLYQNLTLISGGTLALSVTFLGYLINQPHRVVELWVLEVSWAALIVCLICSTGYIFSHGRYTFFALEAEHGERQKDMLEVEITEFDKLRYGALRSPTERSRYRIELNSALERTVTGLSEPAGLAKRYFRLAKWYEHGANMSFVLGLALLLLFAILNT